MRFKQNAKIQMLILAEIPFSLSSLLHLVFRVDFSWAEQLWAKLQILKSDQCLEKHEKITFLQLKWKTSKIQDLSEKMCLIPLMEQQGKDYIQNKIKIIMFHYDSYFSYCLFIELSFNLTLLHMKRLSG